jgi:hypothetical protein
MMKAAGVQHVRVSAMQHPVISAQNGRDLRMILNAGMGLVVVVQATAGYLTLDEKAWAAYCRKVVQWLPIGGPGQTKVQPGNEMNTEFGTGKGIRPDAGKAVTYLRIACDIILSKFPKMYLIAPGVTNESKTQVSKGKISARDFLEALLAADLPFSSFGYHFYFDRPDKPKDLALLKSNIAYLKNNGGGRPIILTETGAADPMNALKWYGMLMRGELKGIEDAGWYCMDHHKAAGADFQLVDNALNPSPLYQRMVEDATLGVGR